ncbi:MAG: hypothetical protein WD118_08820 [Phycisphaeraceae bacterium]
MALDRARLKFVLKSRPRVGFAHIGNVIFNDERLAVDEMGVLAFLLSKPDNWEFSTASLSKRFDIGDHKVRRIVANLIRCSYMWRARVRENGEIVGMNYFVSDDPDEIERARAENPDSPDAHLFAVAGEADPQPAPGGGFPGVVLSGVDQSGLDNRPPILTKEKLQTSPPTPSHTGKEIGAPPGGSAAVASGANDSDPGAATAAAQLDPPERTGPPQPEHPPPELADRTETPATAPASGTAAGSAGKATSEIDARDAAILHDFETLIRLCPPEFLDNRAKCWKIWLAYQDDARAKALNRYPQVITGHRAAYARWKSAAKSERPRRPPKLEPLSEYLGDKTWRSVPAPITSAPTPVDDAQIEAERAAVRAAEACNKYSPHCVFVACDDPAFRAWAILFRRAGVMLGYNAHRFADARALGGFVSRHGRYFPSQWPPGALPKPPPSAAALDEFAELHHGAVR